MSKRIDWKSAQGKKVILYIIKLRESKKTFPEIEKLLNEKFDLPIHISNDSIRKQYNKHKNDEEFQELAKKEDKEIESLYQEIEEKEAAENAEEEERKAQEEAIEEAKEKARKDRDKKLLTKLLKERGTTELIVETFRDTIQSYPFMDISVPDPVKKNKGSVEEAVLLFSDAQIGEHITSEDTQGFGEYNIGIFKDRMDKLVNRMRRITESHKQINNIETLNLFMLGDNVDGIGIYRGQEHHLDALVVEQLLVGSEKIAEGIIQLLGTFKKIKITGIVGNHGRIGRKGENPTHVNFDYLLYKMLEKLLQNYKERIEWTIPKSNWILQNVLGNGFLLLHGDTIKGWNGIPYYGIDRADSRLTKMLQAHGKTYTYLCLGHHHNPGDVDSPNGEKILNGTMVGGSNFSINQLHTTSRPSQWFFGINKIEGISWRYKILLDIEEDNQ